MSPNKRYIGKLAPEQALELFHNMLEHMPVGVALFDGEFRMVAINQTALDMLDFPAELFSPQMPTLEDLLWFNARRGEYGPGVPETLVRERLALAAKREAHRFVRHRPDGKTMEVIGAPLPGGGFVSIYIDITERQRATAQINEQALYLRSVLAHLPQGISVFDAQLRLKCWNDKLLDVLGLPDGAVYPDVPFEDLIRYPAQRGEYGPDDPETYVQQRREWALRFEPHRVERTRPTGRTHLVEGRPMVAGERTVGFVTSYTDITENKAREAALAEKTCCCRPWPTTCPAGSACSTKTCTWS